LAAADFPAAANCSDRFPVALCGCPGMWVVVVGVEAGLMAPLR